MSNELVCAAQGPGKGPVDSLAGTRQRLSQEAFSE